MKRFFKYAALIAAVMMVCGSAWAYDYATHIAQAPNNKGDAMIFPYFLALEGGWQSTMTVINTDEYNSTVAKIVFRSFKNSEELLDFLIYLSPGDVWKGKIYYDTTSKEVTVYSDDDSIVIDSQGTFATADKPFKYPMFPVVCPEDGTNWGYVEVIEAAIGPINNPSGIPGPGVKKSEIYSKYNPIVSPGTTAVGKIITTKGLYYPKDFYYASNIDAAYNPNVLAGYMEWGNPTLGLTGTFSATTMQAYLSSARLKPNIETILGQDCDNSFGEIDAALAKNNIAMPYVSDKTLTLHMFTFPTKGSTAGADCKVTDVLSPYFQDNLYNVTSKYCVVYGSTNYDLKENYNSTPVSGDEKTYTFCDEVNAVSPNEFAEGWSSYMIYDNSGADFPYTYALTKRGEVILPVDAITPNEYVGFDGAPVIPMFVQISASGLQIGYGASTDAYVDVFENLTTVGYDADYYWWGYQYTPYLPENVGAGIF